MILSAVATSDQEASLILTESKKAHSLMKKLFPAKQVSKDHPLLPVSEPELHSIFFSVIPERDCCSDMFKR